MALILRCLIGCRNQCNTKKLGFFSSHLTKHHHHHHHHLIPSSLSFSTTTTGTTTLPAEGSPDEHHRRGGIRTSIINERPADDSTKTTLPENEHCVETLTLGGGLGDLGGATEKQRDAEINSLFISLGQFAAFAIGEQHIGTKGDQYISKKIELVRVVSAKVQQVRNGRFYYITIEALDSGVKKLYEAHVLDTRTQRSSISLKEWCEIKVPMSSTQHFF